MTAEEFEATINLNIYSKKHLVHIAHKAGQEAMRERAAETVEKRTLTKREIMAGISWEVRCPQVFAAEIRMLPIE